MPVICFYNDPVDPLVPGHPLSLDTAMFKESIEDMLLPNQVRVDAGDADRWT